MLRPADMPMYVLESPASLPVHIQSEGALTAQSECTHAECVSTQLFLSDFEEFLVQIQHKTEEVASRGVQRKDSNSGLKTQQYGEKLDTVMENYNNAAKQESKSI